MAQSRGKLDLAEEAFAGQRFGDIGAEDLYRDLASVLAIVGEVDRGHAALAELPIEAVAVGEGIGEGIEVSHGTKMRPRCGNAKRRARDASMAGDRYVAQPVVGGASRRLSATVAGDLSLLPSGNAAGVRSSDGSTTYFLNYSGARSGIVVGLRLADGAVREVLRFDEAARPHSNASNGIAEYAGWLYFTLSDLQSDIWVAKVTGLKP